MYVCAYLVIIIWGYFPPWLLFGQGKCALFSTDSNGQVAQLADAPITCHPFVFSHFLPPWSRECMSGFELPCWLMMLSSKRAPFPDLGDKDERGA